MITAIGVIYILFNVQKIRRLHVAVKILQSASRMTNLLFQIYFIPVMSALVTGIFLYSMLMKTVYAYSSGEIIRTEATGNRNLFVLIFSFEFADVNGGEVKILEEFDWLHYQIPFDLIIVYVVIQVLLSFEDLMVAMVITIWFFTKKKNTVRVKFPSYS